MKQYLMYVITGYKTEGKRMLYHQYKKFCVGCKVIPEASIKTAKTIIVPIPEGQIKNPGHMQLAKIFVPFRGFLFLNYELEIADANVDVFVPSRGFLFLNDPDKSVAFTTFLVFVPSRGFLFLNLRRTKL